MMRRVPRNGVNPRSIGNETQRKALSLTVEWKRNEVVPKTGVVMTKWRWGILLFELFLLLLILFLPQVDLPDFAFHGGTAPIIARSRVCAQPLLTVETGPTQPQSIKQFGNREGHRLRFVLHETPRSLLSLLCSLLC